MKKLLLMLLCLLMLCGCGSKKEDVNSSPAGADTSEEKQEETVTVDENLLDVTVTLPNSFFESFETTAEDYVASMNEGDQKTFKEVKVNDDGSVSITMTRGQYNEFMGEMEKSIDDSLKEMIDGGDFAFVSIDHDKKYENFTVTLSTNELGFAESFSVMGFAMLGGIYQLFDGNQNPNITVKFIGANGTEIQTWNSADMANQ